MHYRVSTISTGSEGKIPCPLLYRAVPCAQHTRISLVNFAETSADSNDNNWKLRAKNEKFWVAYTKRDICVERRVLHSSFSDFGASWITARPNTRRKNKKSYSTAPQPKAGWTSGRLQNGIPANGLAHTVMLWLSFFRPLLDFQNLLLTNLDVHKNGLIAASFVPSDGAGSFHQVSGRTDELSITDTFLIHPRSMIDLIGCGRVGSPAFLK